MGAPLNGDPSAVPRAAPLLQARSLGSLPARRTAAALLRARVPDSFTRVLARAGWPVAAGSVARRGPAVGAVALARGAPAVSAPTAGLAGLLPGPAPGARAATPTTVELSAGARPGGTGDREAMLAAIREVARRQGLGEEGTRVVEAIAVTEGGLTGAVGDLAGGGSYGPLQLYWGGQLRNLARDRGLSLRDAATWVQEHPIESVEWGLRPGGYLGDTIRRGVALGLRGPALATYAQRFGQVSIRPERAGANYLALFGAPPAASRA